MSSLRWRVAMGVGLVALSATAYAVHYLAFRDVHHILVFLVGDIAFVPIEVLLVTLVIHELLRRREKRTMLHKLNMVIGAFFSEVGTEALTLLGGFDPDAEQMAIRLRPAVSWSDADFAHAMEAAGGSTANVDSRLGDIVRLKAFLVERRGFLLRLLENPTLLEHDTFTDLLWATFHLTEELENRSDLTALPESDLDHISGDIHRAYAALVVEWLAYMRHLKSDYPYLYSLAMRTNPFDPEAHVEVV